MPSTMRLISKTVLGSNQATVTFSNIPQTHTDLVVIVSSRTDAAGFDSGVNVRFNGSTSNLSGRNLFGWPGGSPAVGSQSNSSVGTTCGNGATANTFGNLEMYISNYTSGTAQKSWSSTAAMETNATQSFITATAGLWASVEPVTSLVFVPSTGTNFLAGTSFFLYGITKA